MQVEWARDGRRSGESPAMRLFKNRLQAANELASDLAYLKPQRIVVLRAD